MLARVMNQFSRPKLCDFRRTLSFDNQIPPSTGNPLNSLNLANPSTSQEYSYCRQRRKTSWGSLQIWFEKNRTKTTGQMMLQCFLPRVTVLHSSSSLLPNHCLTSHPEIRSYWHHHFENTFCSKVILFKPRLWSQSLFIFKPLSNFRIGICQCILSLLFPAYKVMVGLRKTKQNKTHGGYSLHFCIW